VFRSINQITGWIAGIAFVVVGMLGFTVSGGHHAAGMDGGKLLGLFQVNILHNFVHLAVGILLIVGAMGGVRSAKALNTLVGLVYLAVGIAGLFTLDSSVNVIALNGLDNTLHLVAGAALLVVGRFVDRPEVAHA
jgi:hypothetical protein